MATFTVRKDGSGTHTEIQAAIYDAAAGDTIDISASTFSENIDLYKGVTLQGAGREVSIIQGSLETSVVRTFTCALGSTTLTMAAGTSGLKKGRLISGTGIPANARIASISANSITISAATTAARNTATNATMPTVESTIRVRGSGGTIKGLKVIGFDSPSAASEMSAVFYRNTGGGSAAATNQILEDSWLVADGEYAILTDAIANVQNITIRNNKITGKTFVGTYPGVGNQFTVPNVPRQLVTIQSANVGCSFTGNLIEGITGGLTENGTPSFNTACTIDPASAIVQDNVVKCVSGYGYGLRVRGASALVEDNTIYSFGAYSSAGFLVSGAGAVNTGNQNLSQPMVQATQASAGQSLSIFMTKELVMDLPKVQESVVFSDYANWAHVSFLWKKADGSTRMYSTFRDFTATKQMKIRQSAPSGAQFQLHKIIISNADRSQMLVVKRDEVDAASGYDFTLL